jgi:hypothetical protein
MNPNTYLKSMWRNSYKPIVFVAMSLDDRFEKRFNEVIKPAIEQEVILGHKLSAYRVDLSRSGESIITEISDGIAHCFLFLADVSTVDVLRFSEQPARNSNVLYEVGIALACRLPEEVLLIRDDNDPLIFDTSSIPHKTIDFSNNDKAITEIRSLLIDRARERKIMHDARVLMALQHLTTDDLNLLRLLFKLEPNQSADLRKDSGKRKILSIPTATALKNLMANDLAVASNLTENGGLTYKLTDIGRAVAERYELISNKMESTSENKNS